MLRKPLSTPRKNLKYIGNDTSKKPNVYPTPPMSGIVYTALKKHMSAEESDSIINGYRRSQTTQDRLINNYLENDIMYHQVKKDKHYQLALQKVKEIFSPARELQPVAFPDIRYYPWNLSASAEQPLTSDKAIKDLLNSKFENGKIENNRCTFHNLYNEMLVWNRQNVHRIKDGVYTDIAGRDLRYMNTAHARSHLVKSDDDDKIRMVYGVPKLLLMVECMFLWPLQVTLLERDGPILWGYETLTGGWYKIYNWATTKYPATKTWLAYDWKGFDKHALFDVIDDLHNVIRSYYNFEHGYFPTYDYPDTYTNPERLERLWNWMCDAIKTTPDILPNGDIYIRQFAGIASGYFETQMIGSMYNSLMLLTVLSKMGININKVALKVQGDDSLIGLHEQVPSEVYESFMEQFAHEAKIYFGSILNIKKSKMSNTLNGLPLLGFRNRNSYPTRDKEDLLASLLYPEKQTDLPRLAARAIGIAWANCGNHEIVYRVCEDVFNYIVETKGLTPNPKGLPDMIMSMNLVSGDIPEHIKMEFPSWYDTVKNLINISVRSEAQSDRMWPRIQFTMLP